MKTLSWLMLTALTLTTPMIALRSDPPAQATPNALVSVRLLDAHGQVTSPRPLPKVAKSEAAWRAQLTPAQYRILRTHDTERAFCGAFHDQHAPGVYACLGCGLPLFRSTAKFDSGTGWPSFFEPVASENIGRTQDGSYGVVRTEVHCARCESHLGHVFEDGPAPTGQRYCINSDALTFHARPAAVSARERVLFGAGCFWGVEQALREIPGVTATRVGYAGGHTLQPTYEQVCSHTTGHAEVVEVEYDPARLPFAHLLEAFWKRRDPSRDQSVGPDHGDQYRSAIFFTTPEQEAEARASADTWSLAHGGKAVRTEISLAAAFQPAEEYHQRYYEKHGGPVCRDAD